MDNLGPLGLFFSSFLAATILPFSSELALVGAVELGMHGDDALLYASFGNCLAVLLNYLLGYFLYQIMHSKIQASKTGQRAYALLNKYGYYTLVLSPLPIIGDPVTIAAGLMRLNMFWFILITFSLRIFRYWFILSMLQ